MKLTLDARSGVNLIRSYAPGEVRVGERTLITNCIISADRLIPDWKIRDIDDFGAADLQMILDFEPQIVLLGTGATQRFPSAQVRSAFAEHGVALEPMDLGAACRTFNILVQEERQVVAALLVR